MLILLKDIPTLGVFVVIAMHGREPWLLSRENQTLDHFSSDLWSNVYWVFRGWAKV